MTGEVTGRWPFVTVPLVGQALCARSLFKRDNQYQTVLWLVYSFILCSIYEDLFLSGLKIKKRGNTLYTRVAAVFSLRRSELYDTSVGSILIPVRENKITSSVKLIKLIERRLIMQ